MKALFKMSCVLFALALLIPVGLWAQGGSTGAITGTVQDPAGARVPDAKVLVIRTATGITERETTTTGDGIFNAPLLPPGDYRVVVTAPGFAKYEATKVVVLVTETTTLPIKLKIGAVTETVMVSSEVAPVPLANAATGEVIGAETVAILPLSTRNFLTLLTLSAGSNTELFDSGALGRGQVSINVNGQRPVNNNFQLEGINANDVNLPILDHVAIPNPEALAEYKTQTSLYDASNGRNGGGNVQVLLKSGGDKYHGNIYEFGRDTIFNANDWFANSKGNPRSVLNQNQFGATFGGPVPGGNATKYLKDFFFFGNYQGTREKSGLALGTAFGTTLAVLPATAAGRTAANLTTTFFPNGVCGGLVTTECIPPGAVIDPVALALLNLPASKCPGFNDGTFCIPTVPGTAGLTGAVVNHGSLARSIPGVFNDNQYVLSFDKTLNTKDKLSVRWFWDNGAQVQPFGVASTLPFAENFPNHNRFLKLGWTRVWSNSIVNEARFGLNRFFFQNQPTEPILLTDIGETRGNSAVIPAASRFSVSGGGGFSIGTGVNDDRGGTFNTFSYADDVRITKGKHLISLGFDISRYQLNRFNRFATRGNVAFANTPANDPAAGIPALAGFQNFLLGRVTSTQGGAGFFNFYFRALDAGAYIQDDWKIAAHFTLNLGLRWEGLSTAHEKFNHLGSFSGLGDGTPGPIAAIHPSATARVGTAGVSSCTLLNCFSTKNYAPRVGFAWDLFGNQKTVLRAGYGLYYQRVSNQSLLQTSGGLPFSEPFSASPFSVTTANPFPNSIPDSAFPLPTDTVVPALVAFRDAAGNDPRGILGAGAPGAPIFLTASGRPLSGFYFYPQRNFRPPRAMQWNLTVERQLFGNWALEVGYVATRGISLIGTGRPFNPGQICGDGGLPGSLPGDPSPCRIGPAIGANVMVTAGSPGVTKNADGSILITDSNPDNINARVPTAYLGLANSRGFFQGQDGSSVYHSLQATLSHHFSDGLYLQAAYTYSKSLDNSSGSAFGDELNGLTQYGDLFSQRNNRGVSDFNRPHRFVVSYNYELPIGKWTGIANSGFLGRVVNGWGLNGVTTFQSGNPINTFDSSAVLLQDTDFINTTNFALAAPGVNPYSTGSLESRLGNYLNLVGASPAFVVGGQCVNSQNVIVPFADATCTGFTSVGNVGRNRFIGPFQQNWDMSITKVTKVTERVGVEFRAEFFNIFNHPVFNSPGVGGAAGNGSPTGNLGNVDVSSGDSSIVATANRPRIIQFALKVSF